MIVSSALIATLYFGGWSFPFVDYATMQPNVAAALQVITFVVKTGIFIFIYMWIRWTLPRFRYDQLMNLGWKVLLPLAFLNLLGTGAVMLAVK